MNMDLQAFESVIYQERNQSQNDVFAKFYDRAVKTNEVNPNTGLPVFKDVCFVEIRIKNNATDIYDQPASEEKKRRFPVEYNRYLLQKEKKLDGAPLEEFAFLTASEVASLKCHGILTVEALSSLETERAQTLGVLHAKEKANAFLSVAKNVNSFIEKDEQCNQLKQELNLLVEENSALKTKISELENKLLIAPTSGEKTDAVLPKKRGRKKKSEAEIAPQNFEDETL